MTQAVVTRDRVRGSPTLGKSWWVRLAFHLLTSFHQTVTSSILSFIDIHRTLGLFVLMMNDNGEDWDELDDDLRVTVTRGRERTVAMDACTKCSPRNGE